MYLIYVAAIQINFYTVVAFTVLSLKWPVYYTSIKVGCVHFFVGNSFAQPITQMALEMLSVLGTHYALLCTKLKAASYMDIQ